MNFYQHQDDAKSKTTLLVFLLVAAVLSLIVITVIFLSVFIYFFESHSSSIAAVQTYQRNFAEHLFTILKSEMFLYAALGVSLLVGGATLFKSMQLKRGGAYVAQALGGVPLNPETNDQDEKRLLNIVEEMAIASGSPVPQVYILEQDSVNAFAAGHTLNNAVIGVTRGCISLLNRDQMQGVIAHEFSHIHHGDMRLNMKLLSILYGITMIGLLGQFILRGSAGRSAFRSRRSKSSQQLIPLALGLMAIGFGGSFFGSLIKSAVSRQREFLADASAVQFTRNPTGIAGALLKIKRHATGAKIQHSNSSEFSHFYFADGVSGFFTKLFATHPPLDTRISRVYPHSIEQLEQETLKTETVQQAAKTASDQASAQSKTALIERLVTSAGVIGSAALHASERLLHTIPEPIYQACHNAYQARALIYGLLLSKDTETKDKQIQHLSNRAHPATFKVFLKLYKTLERCEPDTHMPLLQLCMPALQTMSAPQTKLFLDNIDSLIGADNKVSPTEWAFALCLRQLSNTRFVARDTKLANLRQESIELLSLFAYFNGAADRQKAFNTGLEFLWPDLKNKQELQAPSFNAMNRTMDKLAELRALDTPKLLKALLHCAQSDQVITNAERATLQAIALYLDTPIPLIDPE